MPAFRLYIDFYLSGGPVLERTLILVKPDGVQRGLIGDVIQRLERRGLRLVGMKFMQMSQEMAETHYGEHEGKPFYPGLVAYITSGPIVAMVWEGVEAIAIARKTMGSTRPGEAEPGTIRGDFALEVGRNIVHGSDGPESAAREINLFFDAGELVEWNRDIDPWVFE
jgi:nucleoside-diphosphate kinase